MSTLFSAAAASHAMAAMIDQAKASVVQVHSGRRGIGTGVIWHSWADRTAIVTNAHVVVGVTQHVARHNGQTSLRVVAADGRTFDAEVLASNPQLDLALLGVAAGRLPSAQIGDSTRLRVGEIVFAIGNPWGQVGVVTAGIISGLGRMPVQGVSGVSRTAQYIRSDVLLAPGNSGGPLLNAAGAVVGINAMIFGGDLSVAIPSHVVGQVVKAWIDGEPDRLLHREISA